MCVCVNVACLLYVCVCEYARLLVCVCVLCSLFAFCCCCCRRCWRLLFAAALTRTYMLCCCCWCCLCCVAALFLLLLLFLLNSYVKNLVQRVWGMANESYMSFQCISFSVCSPSPSVCAAVLPLFFPVKSGFFRDKIENTALFSLFNGGNCIQFSFFLQISKVQYFFFLI